MKRVLIIEDDPAIADFAVAALSNEGYEVSHAPDGEAGLNAARDKNPDVVVLDLMMPGLHGLAVVERMRKENDLRSVPILITSAKSYEADISTAKSAGANDYLTKPYRASELMKKVADLLTAENGNGHHQEDEEAGTVVGKGVVHQREVSSNQDVSVRFWGTRGSCPAPGPDTVRYGGNTSCTELRIGDQIMVIDCGSGLRDLGESLFKEYPDQEIEGHLFVGHTHWDHIQGFPFFRPFYVKKNKFNIYSVRGAGKSLERVFRGQMASDYFPVPLKSLACQLQFVEMEAPIEIGPVTVRYHFLNHPGVAIGFRFDAFGKSVTYISDHETFARLSGDSPATRKQDQDIVDFARGSDVLISVVLKPKEAYEIKRGWGHSTFPDVIRRGIDAECKHLVLFHHDPTHTDEMMDGFLDECRDQIRKAGSSMHCSAARERHSIEV